MEWSQSLTASGLALLQCVDGALTLVTPRLKQLTTNCKYLHSVPHLAQSWEFVAIIAGTSARQL